MGFLAKIRNSIKHYKNRDFRTSVEREKNQKYLLQERMKISQKNSIWKSLFQRDAKRNSFFSRFFQQKITSVHDIIDKQKRYLGMIGAFLIGASLYIIIYSPYFHISSSKVLMQSLTDGIDITIAYRAIEDSLYGKSVFFIDERNIAQLLKKYQKNISRIQISRLYPNGLKISLSSYPIPYEVSILGVPGVSWGMSENGILIPKNQVKTPSTYTFFIQSTTLSQSHFLDYKEALPEAKIRIIEKTLGILEKQWKELGVKKIIFLEEENEFHIVSSGGSRILFTLENFSLKNEESSTQRNLQNQILSLNTFLEKNHTLFFQGRYTYVDSRIPGKIFSCEEKNTCNTNLKLVYGEGYPTD